MKPFSFLKISASLLALAAMLVTTSAQAETAEVKVVSISGTATVNGQPLTKESVVKEGDKIVTFAASKVKLVFADSELNVEPDTEVVLEKLQFTKQDDGKLKHDTSLDLKKGGLIGNVKKISKSSEYNVKHAQGVAGIRGTTWAILPGLGIICSEGSVVVSLKIGNTVFPPVTLGPGQMAVITPNGPQVINIPPAVAGIIAGVFGERHDSETIPVGLRDTVITVTAQAGEGSTTRTETHQPN